MTGLLSIGDIIRLQGGRQEVEKEILRDHRRRILNVKEKLEELVAEMYVGGILYPEAVREFKRRFILRVARGNKFNQSKAARELGMHRNTLNRTIAELGLRTEFPPNKRAGFPLRGACDSEKRGKPAQRVTERPYIAVERA